MKEFFKKYSVYIILLGIIIVLSIYSINLRNNLSKSEIQSTIDKQNYTASIDSITKTYNKKIEEYQFTTNSFIGKLSDLEKYDKELSDKLSKMKGDVLAAVDASIDIVVGEVKNTKTTISQTNDSTFISKGVYSIIDSGFSQKLEFRDSLRVSPIVIKTKVNDKDTIIVKNNVKSLGMNFGENKMKLDLTFGFTEEKKQYKVWATSPSKYVNISEMTGYYKYFPKIYHPWVVSAGIGYGLNYHTGNIFTFGPTLNVSVGYKVFEFGKKFKK